MGWFIRQLQCSSIYTLNILSIAYNHHTNITPLLNISTSALVGKEEKKELAEKVKEQQDTEVRHATQLALEREKLRKEKKYEQADELSKQLKELGVKVQYKKNKNTNDGNTGNTGNINNSNSSSGSGSDSSVFEGDMDIIVRMPDMQTRGQPDSLRLFVDASLRTGALLDRNSNNSNNTNNSNNSNLDKLTVDSERENESGVVKKYFSESEHTKQTKRTNNIPFPLRNRVEVLQTLHMLSLGGKGIRNLHPATARELVRTALDLLSLSSPNSSSRSSSSSSSINSNRDGEINENENENDGDNVLIERLLRFLESSNPNSNSSKGIAITSTSSSGPSNVLRSLSGVSVSDRDRDTENQKDGTNTNTSISTSTSTLEIEQLQLQVHAQFMAYVDAPATSASGSFSPRTAIGYLRLLHSLGCTIETEEQEQRERERSEPNITDTDTDTDWPSINIQVNQVNVYG